MPLLTAWSSTSEIARSVNSLTKFKLRNRSQKENQKRLSLQISTVKWRRSLPDGLETTMQQPSDWWPRCAFVRDYFFGGDQKVAHQVAEYLAKYYVGDAVSELRPDTDVSALIGDSIRRRIDKADFTLVRDDDLFAEIDLMESITFKEIVTLVQSQRERPPS